MKLSLISLLFLFIIPFTLIGQNWNEIAKALPEKTLGLTPYGSFSKSMDIDGNYAIIGAQNYAVVLFYNGSNWVAQAELTASGYSNNFGISVGISGDNIVIGSAGKSYVFEKPVNGWTDMTETAILTTTSPSTETVGKSVSIFGDHIVVGDPNYNNNTGAAYVYSKPNTGWSNTTQTAKLTALGGLIHDSFGYSVDISADYIIVGLPQGSILGTNTGGKAVVFEKPASGWVDAVGTIFLSASNGLTRDRLGMSVSISGDYIAVGAPYAGFYGKAYIYKKPTLGWITTDETAILTQRTRPTDTIPTQTILFGQSVCISGDKVVVGGYDNPADYNLAGFAYVFNRPSTGWQDTTEIARLTTSNNATFNRFGINVGISMDKVMVSAVNYTPNSTLTPNLGAVYTYDEPATGWVDTSETQEKVAPSRLNSALNRFGGAVDIDGDYAVVSSLGFNSNEGRVSVLFYDGNNWNLQAQLTGSDITKPMVFGQSVSISGDYVAIGASKSEVNNVSQGAVYLYKKPLGGWVNTTETAKLTASDGAVDDGFGSTVSISGNDLVVGANKDDDLGNSSGAVYVFTKPSTGWINMTETAKLLPSDGSNNDGFGQVVNIDGDHIIIGTPSIFDFGPSASVGAAYVFTKPSTGWANMTETAKLTPSDGIPGGYFGISVGISGDDIIIGASKDKRNGITIGAAYLFTKPTTGWSNATETAKLTPFNKISVHNFGSQVAIEGNQIVIGAYLQNVIGSQSGSAYSFTKPTTGWVSTTEDLQVQPSDGASNDYFGGAIAISGDYSIIASYNKSDRDLSAGAVYLFKSCPVLATTIDTTISQGTSFTVGNNTYTTSGIYQDTFTTQDCDSIVTTNLTINLGIDYTQNASNSTLAIHPNPSSGTFSVAILNPTQIREMTIEIFDNLGQSVYYNTYQDTKADIHLNDFTNGIYFVKVNQQFSHKILLLKS